MDKEKIAKLCNEIEDVACDIARITMNDIISAESRMVFDKAKEISAEITAPPKSNADRIRQMTDEELFDFLDAITDTCGYLPPQCDNCQMKYKDTSPKCDIQAWLKQEVIEGDTD